MKETRLAASAKFKLCLVFFGTYAVFRTAVSLYGFFNERATFQHDIYVQYIAWLEFIHRDTAKDVLSHLTYLPHVWLLLTPIFALGWNTVEWVWCLICVALHIYIWNRISNLCLLNKSESLLFLILYFCLLSVGLTIALGNLVVISFAAILAAFPFERKSLNGFGYFKKYCWLFISTVKHITVFPVFLMLLFKRPRLAIPVLSTVAGILLTGVWWAHLSLKGMMQNFQQGDQLLTTWMHKNLSISLVPLAEPFGIPGTVLLWIAWLILFGFVVRLKDPFIQLSGLLLIAVLPIHHRDYDLIVSAPVIALLIKQRCLAAALIVTAGLSGLWDAAANRHFFGLQHLNETYHQLLVLILIAIIFWLDRQPAAKIKAV